MTRDSLCPRARVLRSVMCGAATVALLGCGASHRSVAVQLRTTSAPRSVAAACGKQASYLQYAAHHPIGVAGTVKPPPAGHWRAKLKIKRCGGGVFRDLRNLKATIGSEGQFGATIAALGPGYYVMRAEIKTGTRSTKGPKLYFHVAQRR